MYQINSNTAQCLNKPVVTGLFWQILIIFYKVEQTVLQTSNQLTTFILQGERTDIFLLQFSCFQIFSFIYSVSSCAELITGDPDDIMSC